MLYELVVETDPEQKQVSLRLRDEHGRQLASNQELFPEHNPASWEGLFDTRGYVDRFAGYLLWDDQTEPATAEQLLEQLGVFLCQEVLGPEIFAALTNTLQQRTLLVRLPKTEGDVLAAAFARVPWEIARPEPGEQPLMESNLVVRVVAEDMRHDAAVIAEAAKVKAGETLKVLLVFAEAPGSRPLAMRLERKQLLDLFYKDILPKRNIQVDALCHGVTRSVIREQIMALGGYHIVHWSGHGHHNLLELRDDKGTQEFITGEELMNLFLDAGGFIPQLVFLSACLSGTFVGVRDWESLRNAIRGEQLGEKSGDVRELSKVLDEAPGYAGTALSLLRSGVPQVIAMRYEVGDDYAREMACLFYRRLLADAGSPPTDSALALARGELLRGKQAAQLGAVNHATPLMFGQEGRLLEPVNKRSEQLNRIRPRPQPLLPGGSKELEPRDNFVGRCEELTRLNVQWLSEGGPAVALVQGMAGLGKTALTAEAIHLWHSRFDYVLAFQAKPTELMLDDFYRQVDSKLSLYSEVYRNKCESSPFECVYLEPSQQLTGDLRYEQMRNNLLGALRDEAILLALDNFETNLQQFPRPEGYACADPQWDSLLQTLTQELPSTRSRLLITSRHRIAELSPDETTLWIALGPLPMGEAALYIRSHPQLRQLFFSDDEGQELVKRLLEISRGHPLIMERLATLANDRAALSKALDQLEEKGWKTLPDLFAPKFPDADREREQEYLEDVAVGSVDLLIQRLTPEARHLLWIVTLANEPVSEEFIQGVWSGQSIEDEQLEQLRALLQMAEQLPEELRQELSNLPPELRELLESSTEAPEVPPLRPLLHELHGAGLLAKEELIKMDVAPSSAQEEEQATSQMLTSLMGSQTIYSFHELVRERISAWMDEHEPERDSRTEERVWVAYGERYASDFQRLQTSGMPRAREVAAEAGRRALVYMVGARAFEKLSFFASNLVLGTRDPTLLRRVIAELKAVADQVPAGKVRWHLRATLADALRRSGQPDQSLALYEQAATEAEEAEDWADVSWIYGNCANALVDVGQLDEAKATYQRCIDAHRKAGNPGIEIVGRDLEMLRINVKQGEAEQALPEINARLDEVRGYWRRHRAGESVPEAPDTVLLGRALVSGLDIARAANLQLKRWETCLELLKEMEQTNRDMGEGEHELARTRFNQYDPMMRLGRFNEAQRVLEWCLDVFRKVDDLVPQANVLSALAIIWNKRGDLAQAIALVQQALSVCNRLPGPEDRAISHANLFKYFNEAGQTEDAARHLLAAIVYGLVTKHQQALATRLRNLGVAIRRAALSGGRYELPRLSGLLARSEFNALRQFLSQFGVDVQQLQGQIDGLVEQVRRDAE